MKRFLLAALFLFLSICAFAQRDPSKAIVKKALANMAGGGQLRNYKLIVTYDLPREVPKEVQQQGSVEHLMKSLMATLPDSMRTAMRRRLDSSMKQAYHSHVSMVSGLRETYFDDLAGRRSVRVRTSPNSLTGSTDTSRAVYLGNTSQVFRSALRTTPVALLQFMASDSAELHHTGTSLLGGEENHLVQYKTDGRWIDVYIGKSSLVVNRIMESQVDPDPLIGRGPEHYQDITIYSGYRKLNGFLFPATLEEISSRGLFTSRKRLEWSEINQEIPAGIFEPEPTYEERFKFRKVKLTDSLFVLLRTGNRPESRSLIRLTSDNRIDCFMVPVNSEAVSARVVAELRKAWPGRTIRDVYCVESLSFMPGMVAFFEPGARVTAPKGQGFMAEERQHMYNKHADSTWKAKKALGALVTFDKNFQRNAIEAYIVDTPEQGRLIVCYYLPGEKRVYYSGNPYQAFVTAKNATIEEKWLFDFLSAKNLKVEKIIFSEAYVAGSPLEMSFDELEKRVKSTDFSEYYRRNK